MTRLRRAYGRSIAEWAELFRVAPRTYSRWEKTGPPSLYAEPLRRLGHAAVNNGFMGFTPNDVKSLEDVLRCLDKRTNMAHALQDEQLAAILREVKYEIEEGARDHLVWLSEHEAEMWTGRKRRWLQREYDELAPQSHARTNTSGEREYRRIALRRRKGHDAAIEGGKRAVDFSRDSRKRK